MSQDGLTWSYDPFSPAAVDSAWSQDPDIDDVTVVARQRLEVSPADEVKVEFLAEGAFNKVYKVLINNHKPYILRVSLPINPRNKTECEVATIDFVRSKTSLPVPAILAYDSTNSNPIGFEYILMEYMPGVQMVKVWHKLPWEKQVYVIDQLVHYLSELYQHSFEEIGGLRQDPKQNFNLGSIASVQLSWFERVKDTTPKGPFNNEQVWIDATLLHVEHESQRLHGQATNGDKDGKSEYGPLLANIKRLQAVVPRLLVKNLPLDTDGASTARCILYHPDLDLQNILLDPDSLKITGIIDWENVFVVPTGAACELPALLGPYEPVRSEEPSKDDYEDDESSDDEIENDEADFDAEGKDHKYWDHLLEYQQTELRPIFLEKMSQLCPGWVDAYNNNEGLRDLLSVLRLIDNPWEVKNVRAWLDSVEAGERRSFRELRLESEDGNADATSSTAEDEMTDLVKQEQFVSLWTPAMLPSLDGATC